MSGPRRLRDTTGGLELDLLRSAGVDAPSPDARAAIAARLGIALPGAGPGVGDGTAAGASSSAGASIAPQAVGSVALWKWIAGIALLGSGAAVVTMTIMGEPATTHVREPVTTRAHAPEAAEEPVVEATAPPGTMPPPEAQPAPVPGIERRSGTPARTPARTPAYAPPVSREPAPRELAPREPAPPSVAEELAAIDEARRLVSRDPVAALARLDAYERRFAPARFAEEATVVRIEALRATGDPRAAGALARRFLKGHPASPLARRVRQALAAEPGATAEGPP